MHFLELKDFLPISSNTCATTGLFTKNVKGLHHVHLSIFMTNFLNKSMISFVIHMIPNIASKFRILQKYTRQEVSLILGSSRMMVMIIMLIKELLFLKLYHFQLFLKSADVRRTISKFHLSTLKDNLYGFKQIKLRVK